MTCVDILSVFNSGLLFLFGAILSLLITGGCKTRREWVIFFALCAFFLAVQFYTLLVFGADIAGRLYPLHIHLPLLLGLTLGLKGRWGYRWSASAPPISAASFPAAAPLSRLPPPNRLWWGRSYIPS